MRALVVLNPNATTTSVRTRDVLLAALSNDLDLEVAETTHRGHATELSRRARADGVDLIVSVGGDGTINEVANGLLADDDGDRPAPGPGGFADRPDVAIIPGGSTNVLARNLGIPESPVEATGLLLDALRSGRRQSIGLGRLDDRYFTFAAGFGLDADVIRSVEAERARGRTSTVPLYVRTAIKRFFAQPDRAHGTIELVADGGHPVPGLSVVIITNCTPWTYLGARPLRPTPYADLNAGLDVFGLTGLRLGPTLMRLGQMVTRRGPRGRNVVSLHDRKQVVLRATADPLPVQVDGDYIGERAEIVLTSVPNALRVAY
ncbi:diacylglycerol/lipid kinase family protein [Jiangella asiatica]|uniref:Diacylglycerol kinase family lipid kinase n=1 Tax=Jiangella asiatica TaxID=2530372 RepID=A0A4R5DSB4_9ACTN|nr:diacylglycerol kinase family protein [Jiangella asiatica]TDE14961.1 diacylglycerol kinase family lipid kinase [Jiangella asiatica]